PAEIAPRAPAQIVAGAVFEKPRVSRNASAPGHFFARRRIASAAALPDWHNIPRGNEPFLFLNGAGSEIPAPLGNNLAAHLAIERHQKCRHQFVVFIFLRLFEEMFDKRLVAGAVQRLAQVVEDLFASPGTWILFPAVS